MDSETLAPLNLLMKAKSKEFVSRLFHEAFRYRNSGGVFPKAVIQAVAEELQVESVHVVELLKAAAALVHYVIFEDVTNGKEIMGLLPGDLNDKLKQLAAKIIVENLESWKASASGQQISLPQLLDFDWRIDVKTSASNFSRLAMPTCLLQLQVQDLPSHVDQVPSVRHVNVEFSRETLDTMLDGLGKIRDQLSSVASKASGE
ncbi:COMM domain-containing protein 9-like [Sycon ciliatum]|uniref:COMM domain-containing protein 9-like n=1 Tax=Sycon ciliatum TaxID=27933 RepID=UPI0031F682A5|eukprot:scpid88919/ scgid6222/ COMM domain-containing protein 9